MSTAVAQRRAAHEAAASKFGWRRAVAASAAIVTAVRLIVASGRTEFTIWPDEPAQLAMARLLGGGTEWTMHDHSTWRPAYAALLSPIHWITDDPTTVFRAALGLNAVLGGVAAAVLVVLARRLTPLGPLGCASIAVCVALSPARLFTTSFVWSESLTTATFLIALIALLRFSSSPTRLSGVALGVSAAAAFGAHSRLLPLSVIVVVAVGLEVSRRRLSPIDASIAIGSNLLGLAVASALSRYVVDQLWREPTSTNSGMAVADRLSDPGAIVIALAGQTWYQLVASIGLFGLGAWVIARNSVGPERSSVPERTDARLVGITVLACMALSIAFMAGRMRADQIVYGRYSDAVTAPVLLIGLATLVTAANATSIRTRVAAACALAATTIFAAAVTIVTRGDVLSESDGLEPMILGLQALRDRSDSIDLVRTTAIALVIGAVLLAATAIDDPKTTGAVIPRHRSSTAIAAVLAIALVVGALRTDDVLRRGWIDRGGHQAVAELVDGPLPSGAPVDFFVPRASNDTDRLMLYQMYLPHSDFTVIENPIEIASSQFVFAPPWIDVLEGADAQLIWTDRFGRMGLWERDIDGSDASSD